MKLIQLKWMVTGNTRDLSLMVEDGRELGGAKTSLKMLISNPCNLEINTGYSHKENEFNCVYSA